jgi:LIVCS family branched-chain amino acid:cation transporter
MKSISLSRIITIGLALFSMLFGAGNLMYPIKVGMESGNYTLFGFLAFCITAVLLPLAGIVSIILFDGDYGAFFDRLGKHAGEFLLGMCILILGPLIAIPRIVTLCHIMLAPFIPWSFLHSTNNLTASGYFAVIFLTITFALSYRVNRIIDVLGYVISPLLITSLSIIIVRGIITADTPTESSLNMMQLFTRNLMRGYETLDLLAALFFTSIIIHMVRTKFGGRAGVTAQAPALITAYAGALCITILASIYAGLSVLGMYHGYGMQGINEGQLFRAVIFTVFNHGGSLLILVAVLTACLSTAVALSALFAEYVQIRVAKHKIGYETALSITMFLCLPLSIVGLDTVLALSKGPLMYIGYPVLIMLTLCNLAYQLYGFSWVKLPVGITLGAATISYFL